MSYYSIVDASTVVVDILDTVGPQGPAGETGPQGPAGPAGVGDWSTIQGKPATYPPTLPIAQSGVTNLVSDLAGKQSISALGASITAYLAALPVYSGSGPAPVPAGQLFLNGGVVMVAQ